jgi:hypothetical protein
VSRQTVTSNRDGDNNRYYTKTTKTTDKTHKSDKTYKTRTSHLKTVKVRKVVRTVDMRGRTTSKTGTPSIGYSITRNTNGTPTNAGLGPAPQYLPPPK